MLKKIFVSAVLLIAVISFVISLLGGNNNKENAKIVPEQSCVAVIRIRGEIVSGELGTDWLGGSQVGVAASRAIMTQIRDAAEDGSVKGLLLDINSPGGSVTAAEEITRELDRFKKSTHKPIVATISDNGASAAYWIAAADSDKIYANASSLTGSIGVYMSYTNYEELLQKIGIKPGLIKSGPLKDIMSGTRPMTDDEKALLQGMVDQMYAQFLQSIAKGRGMEIARVRQLADGRVYTGEQAKGEGLVDEIGNYYDALAALGVLTGLGEKPNVKDADEDGFSLRSLLSGAICGAVRGEISETLPQLLDVIHKDGAKTAFEKR